MGKSICLLILFLGIIMITIGYTRKMVLQNKSNNIDYRKVPSNTYKKQFNIQNLDSSDLVEEKNPYSNYHPNSEYEINDSIFENNLSNFIRDDS